jgi:hypothetical protein
MSTTTEGQTVMVQGRIVWVSGDLFAGKTKTEFNTNRPKLNDQGEQMKEYGFGLAVPKEVFAQTGPGTPGHIWAAIHEERAKLYPSGQFPPGFSMKYKDGDGVDHQGQPYSSREGYADHLIFALNTSIPIKFFRWENNQNIQVNEGIKCGDYVKVQVLVKAHGAIGQGKPGLYLNPNAVQFIGYGKEIINSPSGDQIFGAGQPEIPAGASAMPVGPNPNAQIVPQSTAPAPYHGVLPPANQPTAPAPMATPSFPPAPGNGTPLPQFAAAAPLPQTGHVGAPMAPQMNANEAVPNFGAAPMATPSFPPAPGTLPAY